MEISLGQLGWVTAILILWRLKQEGRDLKASLGYIARPPISSQPTNQPIPNTWKYHEKPSPTSSHPELKHGRLEFHCILTLWKSLSGDLCARKRLSLWTLSRIGAEGNCYLEDRLFLLFSQQVLKFSGAMTQPPLAPALISPFILVSLFETVWMWANMSHG